MITINNINDLIRLRKGRNDLDRFRIVDTGEIMQLFYNRTKDTHFIFLGVNNAKKLLYFLEATTRKDPVKKLRYKIWGPVYQYDVNTEERTVLLSADSFDRKSRLHHLFHDNQDLFISSNGSIINDQIDQFISLDSNEKYMNDILLEWPTIKGITYHLFAETIGNGIHSLFHTCLCNIYELKWDNYLETSR